MDFRQAQGEKAHFGEEVLCLQAAHPFEGFRDLRVLHEEQPDNEERLMRYYPGHIHH